MTPRSDRSRGGVEGRVLVLDPDRPRGGHRVENVVVDDLRSVVVPPSVAPEVGTGSRGGIFLRHSWSVIKEAPMKMGLLWTDKCGVPSMTGIGKGGPIETRDVET